MVALILAAGYGTRLYPLTRLFPKPLLKVKGRPIIDYLVDKLEGIPGLERVYVISNDKFYPKFVAWARKKEKRGMLKVINDGTRGEKKRRGAIGDIHFVIRRCHIHDDLLVIGGDNLFDQSLEGFLRFSLSRVPSPTLGVFDLGQMRKASRFGVVSLDRTGRIARFAEKPSRPQSSLIAMCLYFFPRGSLGLFGRYLGEPGVSNDASGFYIDWLSRHRKVYGYVFQGKWFDVGHIDTYTQVQMINWTKAVSR